MPNILESNNIPKSNLSQYIIQNIFNSKLEQNEITLLKLDQCPSIYDLTQYQVEPINPRQKLRLLCCFIHHQKFNTEDNDDLITQAETVLNLRRSDILHLLIACKKYDLIFYQANIGSFREMLVKSFEENDFALIHFMLTHTNQNTLPWLVQCINLLSNRQKTLLLKSSYQNLSFLDRFIQNKLPYLSHSQVAELFNIIIKNAQPRRLYRAQFSWGSLLESKNRELLEIFIITLIKYDLLEYLHDTFDSLTFVDLAVPIVRTAIDANAKKCLNYIISQTETYLFLTENYPDLTPTLICEYIKQLDLENTLPESEELHLSMFMTLAVNKTQIDINLRLESMGILFDFYQQRFIASILNIINKLTLSDLERKFIEYLQISDNLNQANLQEEEKFKLPIVFQVMLNDFNAKFQNLQQDKTLHTELNLANVANNPESSLKIDQELQQEHVRLNKTYLHQLTQRGGVDTICAAILAQAAQLYLHNPSIYKLKKADGSMVDVVLPLNYNDFINISTHWNQNQRIDALREYYKNYIHGGYRYFLPTNPWSTLSPNNIDNYLTRFKSQLCILWLAANDDTVIPIDGFTLESRVENYFIECAYMLRAHNWDQYKIVTSAKGIPQKKYYDNLNSDFPSCSNGMVSRLLQTLKGYPTMHDFESVMDALITEYSFNHFSNKIQTSETKLLEDILIGYYLLGSSPEKAEIICAKTSDWEPVYIDLKNYLIKKILAMPFENKTKCRELISQKIKNIKNNNLKHKDFFWKFSIQSNLRELIAQTIQSREDRYTTDQYMSLSQQEQFTVDRTTDIHPFEKAIYLSCYPIISVQEMLEAVKKNIFFREAIECRYGQSEQEFQIHFKYTDAEMTFLTKETAEEPLFINTQAIPSSEQSTGIYALNNQVISYFSNIKARLSIIQTDIAKKQVEMFESLIKDIENAPSMTWFKFYILKWVLNPSYQVKTLQLMQDFLSSFPNFFNINLTNPQPITQTPTFASAAEQNTSGFYPFFEYLEDEDEMQFDQASTGFRR